MILLPPQKNFPSLERGTVPSLFPPTPTRHPTIFNTGHSGGLEFRLSIEDFQNYLDKNLVATTASGQEICRRYFIRWKGVQIKEMKK